MVALGRAVTIIKPAGGIIHFMLGCPSSAVVGLNVYFAVAVAVEAVIAGSAAPSVTIRPVGVATLYVATMIAAITATYNIILKYLE